MPVARSENHQTVENFWKNLSDIGGTNVAATLEEFNADCDYISIEGGICWDDFSVISYDDLEFSSYAQYKRKHGAGRKPPITDVDIEEKLHLIVQRLGNMITIDRTENGYITVSVSGQRVSGIWVGTYKKMGLSRQYRFWLDVERRIPDEVH